jgi:chemotaxis protein methyltransferase CheR
MDNNLYQFNEIYFKKIRDIIYDTSSINFTDSNKSILESRLKDRLNKLSLTSLNDYYNLIITNDSELKNLLDSVTTNLTKFFRSINHFNALHNFVLDDLKEKKREKNIRIWSAGCSTGEEPYSIAMIIKEKFDKTWNVKILASDISFNSLMKAKEGFYTPDRILGIPDNYLQKYLVEIGNGYYIKDEIKELVQFDYHNLKNECDSNNFDIVFCRNVIIYFDAEAQEKTINQFYLSMNDYGYLFIGHSESLFGMKTKFIFKKIGEACLYMKDDGIKKK